MKLSSKTQALQDLIAPAVQACNVDLWGIEFNPQGKRSLLRIYIDKDINENSAPVLDENGELVGTGMGMWIIDRTVREYKGKIDLSKNKTEEVGFHMAISLKKGSRR